jgi:WXG100 family type VII secretion target
MSMNEITYNYATIGAFSSDTAQRAAHLMEIHQDILQRTQALADYFLGKGATAYFDAQKQMLDGLENLAQHITQHHEVVNSAMESAQVTDASVQGFFA